MSTLGSHETPTTIGEKKRGDGEKRGDKKRAREERVFLIKKREMRDETNAE